MGASMDLIAGDAREILLVMGLDDPDLEAAGPRFDAHLALGGGLDPTWLDLFAESARVATGGTDPVDLIDARIELDGPGAAAGENRVWWREFAQAQSYYKHAAKVQEAPGPGRGLLIRHRPKCAGQAVDLFVSSQREQDSVGLQSGVDATRPE